MTKPTENLIDKIGEFFKTLYALTMFTIKSLWIILTTNHMQTYKEEREEQKKREKEKNGSKR